jgi:acyl-homoserine-lactone acylase
VTGRRAAAVVASGAAALLAVVAPTAGSALGAAHARAVGLGSTTSRSVTITRDRAGIPHIVARTFTALGYGEGYAFAQDNLCTFANDIVTVEGDRSTFFGAGATAVNYSAGTANTNLDSDLYWHYVQATGLVKRELSAPPPNGLLPPVRHLYTGWVEGYNRYLASGKLRDPACKGKPWVHPVTLADMVLRGEQIVTEASAQQFISDLAQAAPPTAGAQMAAAGSVTADERATAAGRAAPAAPTRATHGFAALRAQLDGTARPQGSNGVGLGALDTRAHTGMVLANPHFPWRGTERFWMAQLDVPGRYDVEGGTLMGVPLVGIGFNRHLAWTHTVSTSDRFVLCQLTLVPGDPTSYELDGAAVKMGRITVGVRTGAGTIHHTFYTTRWGPVVSVASVPGNAYVWNAATAYALYDATAPDGPRTADQYLRMGQATSVKDLYDVEARWLAIPTFNTIAADDTGTAYYGDIGATPAVSSAEISACLPAGVPRLVFDAARVVTLDGSRSACAPADVPGTPERGIFSARSLPHVFRRDYVENSNDSFWLANPSHPLTGFSPIIGLTDTPQDLRTRLGDQMIAARVAGTDGLGPAKFTIPTLQAMWESDRSELALLVRADLVRDCRAHPRRPASDGQTVELTAACAALAGYRDTGRLDDRGGWLFSVWAALDTDSHFFATAFDPGKPLTTPSGLNTSSTATPLTWLADAVLSLRAHGVALDASLRQVQHAPQSARIPIPGCPGEPSSGQQPGCFNAIYSPDATPATAGPVNGGPYGQVNDGSSLVMTTQLTRGGPVSQGILTYSQATDPTSPWYANMTRLYSAGRWVTLPYTARELAYDHPRAPLTLQAP